MPRNGHGQARVLLVAGLGLGCFGATSLRALAAEGFSSARSDFYRLRFPRGLVRKGKKCCQRFSPALPKCNPQGLRQGFGSHRNAWEYWRLWDRAGGCKLRRGRSHCGLVCCKLTPQSQSKPAHADPPQPAFAQVCPGFRPPGARLCSAPAARDERGGAAVWPCRYFAFQGMKELNFSDEEITKDQTSSLVTSCCWDSSSSPA